MLVWPPAVILTYSLSQALCVVQIKNRNFPNDHVCLKTSQHFCASFFSSKISLKHIPEHLMDTAVVSHQANEVSGLQCPWDISSDLVSSPCIFLTLIKWKTWKVLHFANVLVCLHSLTLFSRIHLFWSFLMNSPFICISVFSIPYFHMTQQSDINASKVNKMELNWGEQR